MSPHEADYKRARVEEQYQSYCLLQWIVEFPSPESNEKNRSWPNRRPLAIARTGSISVTRPMVFADQAGPAAPLESVAVSRQFQDQNRSPVVQA
jgi:hypothetical protein